MEDKAFDLANVVAEIQDFLAPKLDSYEQMIYHYLFRHSRLIGTRNVTVGVRTMQTRVGFGIGQAGSPPSQSQITKKLRSLEFKGCIRIIERSREGTHIEVLVPREVPGMLREEPSPSEISMDDLDFYNTPELRDLILHRENRACFYCLKALDAGRYTLDHVAAQSGPTIDHSYRNVVACCFDCNSQKQATNAEDFLRRLYRKGLLGSDEHARRVEALRALATGQLVPNLIG